MAKRGSGSSGDDLFTSIMNGETHRVVAGVTLSTLKLDAPVQNAFISISNNINKLTEMIEKQEKPIKILLYCAGASMIIFSLSSLVRSLGYAFGNKTIKK
jgi:hypothetical protein